MKLKAGDVVEVKSPEEILETLDERASQDALPFMPEMMKFAGQSFTVSKRANKTCDTIGNYRSRRMQSTVHLDDLRCDGGAHGGCQADCGLFWKESWLRRVDPPASSTASPPAEPDTAAQTGSHVAPQVLRQLDVGTRADDSPQSDGVRYRCQATEVNRASTPLAWWDPRQYVREVRSRNVTLGHALVVMWGALVEFITRFRKMPLQGPGRKERVELGLGEGDLVRVKTLEQITATLDAESRNRGLWYDWEMKPFSGGTYRVKRRVQRLIDEKTGRMLTIPGSDCIILDGVVCSGEHSRWRYFCPRAIPPYWRQAWLERADASSTPEVTETPSSASK